MPAAPARAARAQTKAAPKPPAPQGESADLTLPLLAVGIGLLLLLVFGFRAWRRRRELALELREFRHLGTDDSTDPLCIGAYRIQRRLGAGGMAKVYLAQHTSGRKVALKLPDPNFFRTEEHRAYFRQELAVGTKMKHENIVEILDYSDGSGGDIPFIAMEFVAGTTLDSKLKVNEPMDLVSCATILLEVVSALEYAHSLGVVHRDIKPENIMLDGEGKVKVADFGIARDRWEAPSKAVNEEEAFVGSPHYMSPEQINSEPVDYRTDYYSFGVLAFRMLTGRLPFEGNSTLEVITRKISQLPPAVSTYTRGVPLEVEALVRNLMQREPDKRPVAPLEVKKVFKRLIPAAGKRYLPKKRPAGRKGADF